VRRVRWQHIRWLLLASCWAYLVYDNHDSAIPLAALIAYVVVWMTLIRLGSGRWP
jgi:hypothetical protein